MRRLSWASGLILWAVVLAVMSGQAVSPPPGQAGGPRPPDSRRVSEIASSWKWVFSAAVGLGVAIVLWRSIRVRGTFDRGVWRALRIGQAGDWPAAERAIRQLIAEKGTSPIRANMLGLTLIGQQRFEEAVPLFLEAEAGGGFVGMQARANLAVTKWKLGHHREAAEMLAEVCQRDPRNLVHAANYCLVLADLKQTDAARNQLAQVESLRARLQTFGKANRAVLDNLVETCRRKVEGFKPVALEDSDAIA